MDQKAKQARLTKWINESKGVLIDEGNVVARIRESDIMLLEIHENLIYVWIETEGVRECALGVCTNGTVRFKLVLA